MVGQYGVILFFTGLFYSHVTFSNAFYIQTLNSCLYKGYKPTSNSEPHVKPNIHPGAKIQTMLKNQQYLKMLAYR